MMKFLGAVSDWLVTMTAPNPRRASGEESGTFLLCRLPGHAEAETGSPLSVPGFLGYYDGDEFRVAVAVPLSALLYVRLRPRETLCTSLPSPGPGVQP